MNALTAEWVDKAEGDLRTATRGTRVRKAPNYDAACFHCQQCVEKHVKAYLQERNQPFRPIHDLIELLELCLLHDGAFELLRELLESLNKYAVSVRYPGESATKADARNALSAMKNVRAFVRQKLGL